MINRGTETSNRFMAPRSESTCISKRVRRETGPMGNIPLGLSNPRRVPCPPATRIMATLPDVSLFDHRSAGKASIGLAKRNRSGRLGSIRKDSRVRLVGRPPPQLREKFEIDRLYLQKQMRLLCGRQSLPVSQQMGLAPIDTPGSQRLKRSCRNHFRATSHPATQLQTSAVHSVRWREDCHSPRTPTREE